VDFIFNYISVDTFWRTLLFVHFLVAVALLACVTMQAFAVLVPARQTAGGAGTLVDRLRPVPAGSFVLPIVLLYIPNFLLGSWIYLKYRTYVRIPMEQLGHWWTLGAFEFKEHVVTFGLALLPAYWYFWRKPEGEDHAATRRWLTVFLAFAVWYAFLSGHVANDFRGVGS
jgi:hypothetical protein